MLFADEAVINNWLGPVLATVGATIAAIFAYLGQRSKQRFDVEAALLRRDVEAHKKDLDEALVEVAECKEDRKRLNAENREFRTRIEELERRKPTSAN